MTLTLVKSSEDMLTYEWSFQKKIMFVCWCISNWQCREEAARKTTTHIITIFLFLVSLHFVVIILFFWALCVQFYQKITLMSSLRCNFVVPFIFTRYHNFFLENDCGYFSSFFSIPLNPNCTLKVAALHILRKYWLRLGFLLVSFLYDGALHLYMFLFREQKQKKSFLSFPMITLLCVLWWKWNDMMTRNVPRWTSHLGFFSGRLYSCNGTGTKKK